MNFHLIKCRVRSLEIICNNLTDLTTFAHEPHYLPKKDNNAVIFFMINIYALYLYESEHFHLGSPHTPIVS